MEQERKKYYELNEEERKQRRHESWVKFKPTFKRIMFTVLLIALCVLMAFALFGRPSSANEKTSQCINYFQNNLL